ncbi:hypothetical protein E1A91_D05G126000v1 [Gossypium mustelinum]|uniref:Major facilitator superfamily (MFS) profile domain-containing protein n=1 Tax=Gossypium mustelinum TaxID=34275 RepID=A0A5D2UXN6_GOSMU|nr:hypothetical protein E1A91_D05G126000v1 [Gossypium mustelinum]
MMEEREDSETKPLHQDAGGSHVRRINPKKGILEMMLRPIQWLRMLSEELHWSFVLGVVIVYGIISTWYYMKDEQKVQPSQAQPLWGLLTDVVPILGYRRRPYLIFAGFLGVISMLILSLHKNLHLGFALLSPVAGSAGIAIADVAIGACVTQHAISHTYLAGDMQSLCGMSSSIGALLGFSLSGFFVHLVGAKGVFGLLAIPASLVVLVGILLRESQVRNFAYRRVKEKIVDASKVMWTTLKCRDVWRPCLYMYLSLALGLHIHEGIQEVVGSIFSVGAVGSLFGVLLYQNFLKNHPFRDILFWAQLLHGVSGLLDLVLVLRINLKLGMPDYFFVVVDEAVSRMIGRIKWMPFLVLSSKLFPSGIEGTFFALIISIDQIGLLSSAWSGGLVLHMLNVTRTQFDNLWIAIVIRSPLRLIPIGFLFLMPRSDPNLSILPSEMLRTKRGNDVLEPENIEMATLVNSI